jgi:hypothetical protein
MNPMSSEKAGEARRRRRRDAEVTGSLLGACQHRDLSKMSDGPHAKRRLPLDAIDGDRFWENQTVDGGLDPKHAE